MCFYCLNVAMSVIIWLPQVLWLLKVEILISKTLSIGVPWNHTGPFYFWNQCRKESDPAYNAIDIEWWNSRSTPNRLKMTLFKFWVVLCRIRLFPTFISKIKWLGSGLPLNFGFERIYKIMNCCKIQKLEVHISFVCY